MTINSESFSSFEVYALQKGQLDRQDLINYGKKVATTREKIVQFFEQILNIFKFGFKEASRKNEDYFAGKIVIIITDINSGQLHKKIQDIGQTEIQRYLSHLKQGEVLGQRSPHWTTIQFWHQAHQFLQNTRTHLELHWLKSFANADDLGTQLEAVDPQNHQQMTHVIELDKLQREALIPHFDTLLAFVLGPDKLRNISDEQMNKFKLCLELYKSVPTHSKEERLENTKQLFGILRAIEKERGQEARQTFQTFLQNQPILHNLVAHIPPGSVETMLHIQQLCSQISPLPTDFIFSQTTEEMIQKLQDELPQNKLATLSKRMGPEFAQSYSALTTQDQTAIAPSLEKLQKIEEDFRLCGKSQEFTQSMKQAVEKGFKNAKEFAQVIDRLKSQNPLQLHLMTRLGEATRKYISLEISPPQIREFQQQVIKKIEPVTKQLLTQILGGKGDIDERFQAVVIVFNQEQLKEAKKEWMAYGSDFAHSFLGVLGPQVEKGLVHYKEKQTANLTEIEKTFVQFNASYLRSQYGPSLTSHLMSYLSSPTGKEFIQAHPNFIKEEWPSSLKKFEAIKQRFVEQGVSSAEFEEGLHRFLNQSLYANMQGEYWFFLNDESLDNFSEFLQLQITEKRLNEMVKTHGEFFVNSLRDYLKENEPDVLLGTQALQETLFHQASSFTDQIQLLMPNILANFQPFGVVDEKIITTSLLIEPLTPQNLLIRIDNLKRLQELGKSAQTERERALVRELIRYLNPPYLIDLNFNYQKALQGPEKEKIKEQLKITQESIRKLVKFCLKEVDEHQVYSPDLLARGVAELLKQKEDNKETPLKRLKAIADKCDEFFNSEIKENFHAICLQLYVEDIAKQSCESHSQVYSQKISQLVEGLMARFSKQKKGLQSSQAAAYLQDLTQFAVTLSLTSSVDNFTILDKLMEVAKNKHILFDLKLINERAKESKNPLSIPLDVKENVRAQIKTAEGKKTAESTNFLQTIQNDPFAIVNAFLPRFIENLLSPEDKAHVVDIRKALIPLAPLFNQSAYVNKGVALLSQFASLVPEIGSPDAAKTFAIEKIEGFNRLDVEDFSQITDRNKFRQALNSKDLGIWMSVLEAITDRLVDTHARIQATSDIQELAAEDPLVDFLHNTLPKIAEDRKSIQTWIERIVSFLPIIRKIGGGWIANKILKRYIATKLDKVESLDAPTKKLAESSMESIIQVLLLATPALVKNHNIPNYLNFFERLHQLMQQKQEPLMHELFLDVMKTVQQLTREIEVYGPSLEEAIQHTVEQAKF